MVGAEQVGVKRLACEGAGDLARRFRQAICLRSEARAIGAIADQGMTDLRQMDADLMRAAGLEMAFEQRRERGSVGVQNAIVGDGTAAGIGLDRYLLPIC